MHSACCQQLQSLPRRDFLNFVIKLERFEESISNLSPGEVREMFAQTHSLGPAITPPSALPGGRNDDNDDDNDVADVADEDIIDADNDYAAKPPGSSR